MVVMMGICEKCVFENVIKDIPEYQRERYGNMPIYGKYYDKMQAKMCICSDDDFSTTICLDHLGLMVKPEDPNA